MCATPAWACRLHKRQEIFEEFVQADSSHARKFGGTGLGLAISKRLVETMGGEIGVDAAPEGGSCFWFSLPVRAATQAEVTRPLAGLRVAVVSRNRALREGLYLQIAAAASGLPADTSGHADAALIDAGTGNVPELTVHPDPAIPALVLLTPNARGSLEEMRDIGFAGYLVKPVRQSSLVERLNLCRRDMPAETRAPELPPPLNTTPPPVVREPAPQAVDASDCAEAGQSKAAIARPTARRSKVARAVADASHSKVPPAVADAGNSKAGTAHADAGNSRVASARADTPGLHILLAEDNPINMLLIRELLRRRGHRVTEVTTGTAAVAAMEDGGFDLLLTDIHMPGMDGIEAARAIRAGEADSGRPRTPIVALTADALEIGQTRLPGGGHGWFPHQAGGSRRA